MISDKQRKAIKRQQLQHRFHIRRCCSGRKINSITTVASINKSILKYGHRFTRVFVEFAHRVTPSCRVIGENPIIARFDDDGDVKSNPRIECETCSFNILPRSPVLLMQRNLLLPALGSDKIGTIVLDLDETLVHSSLGPPPPRYDFTVSRVMDGVMIYFYVFKRPGVDEFLEIISKKYEIVMFTAGHKAYASKVLDVLDPNSYISHRFYRDSCKKVRGDFVKDLSEFGRDLRKVTIVDDNPKSYSLQPENGIPIKPFYGEELWDRELMKLAGFFEKCDVFPDMRDAVYQYLGGSTKGIRLF
ncbi:putative Haloacid dehalogenase-like hydrolase superfamily protein [Hibiscus syriacus]|uniref:Haloacid dehalogenase-like hydrolase superfamily protein n=1 Tax=Hibiscus syriacus TaxID=106335 RepID=A0A6A2X9R0_HIBSY|nr:CTD small phosphatase-like protein [Hibiscus syriacus]KAE8671798.1 putative Haloacid dehalogenase-like hydrolase superfamily protein [Hibiscus syriacus]